MRSLALVDLSGIFWRHWMAQRDADPVNVPHDRTVQIVREVAAKHAHVAVCCDAKGNWRKQLDPNYKAKRNERAPEAWAQLDAVKETLRLDGFALWSCDGFEADDLIATAVHQVRSLERILPVTIVSSDKDLMALVSDDADTPVVMDRDGSIFREAEVKAKLGVPPRLVRDLLALAGDGSDNVPGVPGVGPVKAQQMLAVYGSFPGVMSALESGDSRFEKAASLRLKLLEGKASAEMSWKLVDMKTDAPIVLAEALAERKPQPVASPSKAREAAGEDNGGLDDEQEQEQEAVPSARDVMGPLVPEAEVFPEAASERAKPQQALAVVDSTPWELQLEPRSSRAALEFAVKLADSRMFPQLSTPEMVLAAILLGRVNGLPVVAACMNAVPIKGKMCMSSAMIIGIVQKHRLCEWLECKSATATAATWMAKRVGRPEQLVEFTIEQAKQAGYYRSDSLWTKDPETILSWRCGTRAARRVFPDVIAGCYSAEEMGDE